MQPIRFATIAAGLLTLAIFGTSCASNSQTPVPRAELRVLLVTGGHDYEKQPFLDLFRSFGDVTFTHVEHTNADALLTPTGAKDFDVLVLYDMWQPIDDAAKAEYIKLATGGKGFVVLHHAIANYNEWDGYAELLGARYYLRPKTIGGVAKARSQ